MRSRNGEIKESFDLDPVGAEHSLVLGPLGSGFCSVPILKGPYCVSVEIHCADQGGEIGKILIHKGITSLNLTF